MAPQIVRSVGNSQPFLVESSKHVYAEPPIEAALNAISKGRLASLDNLPKDVLRKTFEYLDLTSLVRTQRVPSLGGIRSDYHTLIGLFDLPWEVALSIPNSKWPIIIKKPPQDTNGKLFGHYLSLSLEKKYRDKSYRKEDLIEYFNKLSDENKKLITRINLDYFISSNEELLLILPNIEDLNVATSASISLLKSIIENTKDLNPSIFASLKKLRLIGRCMEDLNDEDLINLFKICQRLEDMEICELSITGECFKAAPSLLKRIKLTGLSEITDETLSSLFIRCIKLKIFELSRANLIKGVAFADAPKSIIDFRISGVLVNEGDLSELFGRCDKLEEFELSNMDFKNLENYEIYSIEGWCFSKASESILKITLSNIQGLKEDRLAELLKKLKELEEFSLHNIGSSEAPIEGSCFANVSKSLKKFSIENMLAIEERYLNYLREFAASDQIEKS